MANLRNTTTQYGSVTKFLHWLIFFLLLFMICYGYLLGYVPKAYKGGAYNIHKLTGLSILVLMIARLFWSLINPKPRLPAGSDHTGHYLAEWSMHFLLYAVVIAMPIAGWVGSVAAGKLPHLWHYKIGLPIAKSKSLAESSLDIHKTLAIVIIVLVSLHVLAALYHHIVKKDNVLRRMMP